MYKEFEKWLNEVMGEELPANTKAVGFNLYEDGDVEIVYVK